jgi:hypothetical protein
MVPRNAPTGKFTVWAGMFEGNRRAPAKAPNVSVLDNAVAAATLEVAP